MSPLAARRQESAELSQALAPRRVLPRVNLLPREVRDARRLKQVRFYLAAVVVLVLAGIAGTWALLADQRDEAGAELAASEAVGRSLETEKARYADVPRVVAAIDAAEVARETAMSRDVEWYRYLTALSLSTPSKVWLTALQVELDRNAALAGTVPGAPVPADANPLAVPGIGKVTFQGVGVDHPDVAAWLDMLAKQHGYADPYFSNSARGSIGDQTVVNHTSTVTVTSDALSHNYDRKAG